MEAGAGDGRRGGGRGEGGKEGGERGQSLAFVAFRFAISVTPRAFIHSVVQC